MLKMTEKNRENQSKKEPETSPLPELAKLLPEGHEFPSARIALLLLKTYDVNARISSAEINHFVLQTAKMLTESRETGGETSLKMDRIQKASFCYIFNLLPKINHERIVTGFKKPEIDPQSPLDKVARLFYANPLQVKKKFDEIASRLGSYWNWTPTGGAFGVGTIRISAVQKGYFTIKKDPVLRFEFHEGDKEIYSK